MHPNRWISILKLVGQDFVGEVKISKACKIIVPVPRHPGSDRVASSAHTATLSSFEVARQLAFYKVPVPRSHLARRLASDQKASCAEQVVTLFLLLCTGEAELVSRWHHTPTCNSSAAHRATLVTPTTPGSRGSQGIQPPLHHPLVLMN